MQSRNDGGWNRLIVIRAGRVKWAEIKMSVPNKNRSDLGVVAHFTNIGPVSLSGLLRKPSKRADQGLELS
jgi:hypothetical protein